MPVKGFVVAARNVEGFLKEKLAVLGLNEVETADFMEFWYPKFNSAPYYYITFMEKAEFDKLAPLTVTPAPDSVIRVYMDYAPLIKPVKVTEPVLKTPERTGFAVVEWGGALHR
jgi:mRNA deadenylase 3'-5' endonuclease subunit Ccr4